MGGTATDPGLFINWSLRVGSTARRCTTYGKYLPLSRDLVFDIRLLELWVVNEVLKQKLKSSSRDFYSTVVMWNKIGRNKAKKPQEHSRMRLTESNDAAKKCDFRDEIPDNRKFEEWCCHSNTTRKESGIVIQELDSQDHFGSSKMSFQAGRRKKEGEIPAHNKKAFTAIGDSSISSILSGQLAITPHTKVVVGMSHHDFHERHPEDDGNQYSPHGSEQHHDPHIHRDPAQPKIPKSHTPHSVHIVEPQESERHSAEYESPPHMTRAIGQRSMSAYEPAHGPRAMTQRQSVYDPPSHQHRMSQRMSMYEPQSNIPRATIQRGMSVYEQPPSFTRASMARGMSVFEPSNGHQLPRASTMSHRVFEHAQPVITADSNPIPTDEFQKQGSPFDPNAYPQNGVPPQITSSQTFQGESRHSILRSQMNPPAEYQESPPPHAASPGVSEPIPPAQSQGGIISQIISPPAFRQAGDQENTCRLCTCGGKRRCMICYCKKENLPKTMCTCGGGTDNKPTGEKRSKPKESDLKNEKVSKKETKKREKEEKARLKKEKKEQKAREIESKKQKKKSKASKKKKGKVERCACCKCDECQVCPCKDQGDSSSVPTSQQKRGCCKGRKKSKKGKKGQSSREPKNEPVDNEQRENEHSNEDQLYCNYPDTPCPGQATATPRTKECCCPPTRCCIVVDDPYGRCGPGVVCEDRPNTKLESDNQRFTSVAFVHAVRSGCNGTPGLKKRPSCDCYATKAICSCNCTSKVRSEPVVTSVLPALLVPPELGHGDSHEKRAFEYPAMAEPPFTRLPTTLTSSGNLVINVSKKQSTPGSKDNGFSKHFVPPCVLYLDCTKVKDLCVIIRNNREEPPHS